MKAAAPFQQEKTWKGFPVQRRSSAGGLFQKMFQAASQLPSGGNFEEGVAVHAAGDPDVVEGRVRADGRPVHAADHVGFLVPALVDQFEDVLGADGHVV